MNPPFVIVSLPRSRTAWLSVLLSRGTVCYHDSLKNWATAESLFFHLKRHGYGISDPTLCLVPDKVIQFHKDGARVAVVHRDIESSVVAARASFEAEGLPFTEALDRRIRGCVESLEKIKRATGCPCFEYADLDSQKEVRRIHSHLRPDAPWDQGWYESIRLLRITQIHHKALESMSPKEAVA